MTPKDTPSRSASLTDNQAQLLDTVSAHPGYSIRDGNEDRTMRSLLRRALVVKVYGSALWRCTEAGTDLVGSWYGESE